MSGPYQRHRLREVGLSGHVLEAGTGVGGTWYSNRYPGARFDSGSYSCQFSFSKDLLDERDWSENVDISETPWAKGTCCPRSIPG